MLLVHCVPDEVDQLVNFIRKIIPFTPPPTNVGENTLLNLFKQGGMLLGPSFPGRAIHIEDIHWKSSKTLVLAVLEGGGKIEADFHDERGDVLVVSKMGLTFLYTLVHKDDGKYDTEEHAKLLTKWIKSDGSNGQSNTMVNVELMEEVLSDIHASQRNELSSHLKSLDARISEIFDSNHEPSVESTLPTCETQDLRLERAEAPAVIEDSDDEGEYDDPPEGTPIDTVILKAHMGEKWGYQYIDPNSHKPIPFENEYFKGEMLFMIRMNDRPIEQHPYKFRFEGQKYQFEIQVQGTFQKIPESPFIFIGAEIDRKMSLGFVTKGMASTILNVGRSINRFLHHSFGDKEGMELPHICGPMWSAIDRLVITRPGDEPPPRLGTLLVEDPELKRARNRDPEYDVGIDVGQTIFTMSFKSSNLNLCDWTLENIPLISGTDLHAFWGDGSMRIGCWMVPRSPDLEMVGSGPDAMPKYHKQATNKYMFSVEVAHVSNLSEAQLAEVERAMIKREERRARRQAMEKNKDKTASAEKSQSRASIGGLAGHNYEALLDSGAGEVLAGGSEQMPWSPPVSEVIQVRRRLSSQGRSRRSSYTPVDFETVQASLAEAEDVRSSDSGGEESDGSSSSEDNDDDDDYQSCCSCQEDIDTLMESDGVVGKGASAVTVEEAHSHAAVLAAAESRFGQPAAPTLKATALSSEAQLASQVQTNAQKDLGNHTAKYVVAVVEVDETRLLQAKTVGSTGRRTLYVFTRPSSLRRQRFKDNFVLHTYREFKDELPLYRVQREGGGGKKNSYGLGRKSVSGAGQGAITSRLAESELRRQNLELSFRTLLNMDGLEDEGDSVRKDYGDGPNRFSPDRAKASKDGKKASGKLRDFLSDETHNAAFLERPEVGGGVGSRKLRQGLEDFSHESYACVQVGNFHFSEEYLGLTSEELVFIKPSSRLLGSKKRLKLSLLSIMSVQPVDDADTLFVLAGVKSFSVTTFSSHFVLMVKGQDARDQWVQHIAHGIARYKQRGISSQDLGYSMVTRESFAPTENDGDGTVLPNLARGMGYTSAVQEHHRHLHLLVQPKGLNLGDRLVLNARGYARCVGGGSLYRQSQSEGDGYLENKWAGQSVNAWLREPHELVENLLRRVLTLAAREERDGDDSSSDDEGAVNVTLDAGCTPPPRKSSELHGREGEEVRNSTITIGEGDDDIMLDMSTFDGGLSPSVSPARGEGRSGSRGSGGTKESKECAWLEFLNGVALLQAVDLLSTDPTMSSDKSLCLMLNLYHVLLTHAYLVIGQPASPRESQRLKETASYEAFGDVFNLMELEHAVIKHNLCHLHGSLQQHYVFALRRGADMRVLLALREGTLPLALCHVPIYSHHRLSEQLEIGVMESVRALVRLEERDGNNDTLVLPAALSRYVPASLGEISLSGQSHTPGDYAMVNFLLKYMTPSSEVSDQLINWYSMKSSEVKSHKSTPKFAGAELGPMNKSKRLFTVRFEAPGRQANILRERKDDLDIV